MTIYGILHHPRIPDSEPQARQIANWLAEKGVSVWVASTHEEKTMKQRIPGCTMLVVLGGDGALLQVARSAAPHRVPVFGVNLGKIGFLTESEPAEWQNKLARLLIGDFTTEKRLMLDAQLQRDGEIIETFTALNDIVVGRGPQARVVRFELIVDGDPVTQYTADALIVATPTGSTAYSMAAGGPLLPPQLQNFVVVPVAPHLSFDRALVLHEEAKIMIDIAMDHEAYLTPDGKHGHLVRDGDRVTVQKATHFSMFARVEGPGYFYRRIMGRLGYTR